MILRELKLENFRLFSQITIGFSEKVNIITGMNGQGKTSILESLYYTALTKSFRTNNDKNTIQHEKDYFNIHTSFRLTPQNILNIRVFYSPEEGKHVFLDDKKVTKFSDYIGTVPCVILTLDDLKLALGSPLERRRFLDVLLSQVSPVYLNHLKNYRRSLMQRNALFSQLKERNVHQEFDIWNDKLVEHGSAIIFKRKDFTEYLNENLGLQYNRFVNQPEHISVKYKCQFNSEKESLEKQFYKYLKRMFNKECQRATTLVGPHRDDLEFYKNGKSFREYGSQGENKTLVIALKLSEWEYLSRSRNTNPILLLDDIFGELDHFRIKALVNILNGIGQAFITTTMEEFPFEGNRIVIRNGQISYGGTD